MALIRRQNISYQLLDDQSPTLWDSYVGNWTHYTISGFNNQTVTATPTPGASLTFNFTGAQVVDPWICCVVLTLYLEQDLTCCSSVVYRMPPPRQVEISFLVQPPITQSTVFPVSRSTGTPLSWPPTQCRVAVYSQKPFLSTDGLIIYFQTSLLEHISHEIGITVATANWTNRFIVDYFMIDPMTDSGGPGDDTTNSVPSSTMTSSGTPTVTTNSTPVGPIVGGIVGGIAGIAILGITVWYILRGRSRGGQDYYSERPTSGDMLAREGL
jgi:hypothetical protein